MNTKTDVAVLDNPPRRMGPHPTPASPSAGAGPAAPAVPPPVAVSLDATSVTLTRPDTYRVEARDPDGRLLAYAVQDAFGWAVLVRRRRRVVTAWRVDYGSTAARDVRVVDRLHRAARGVTA